MDPITVAEQFERFAHAVCLRAYAFDDDLTREDSRIPLGALLDSAWFGEVQPPLAAVWYALSDELRASTQLQDVAAKVLPILSAIYVERPRYDRALLRSEMLEHGIDGLRPDLLMFRDKDAAARAEREQPFGEFEWPPGIRPMAELDL